MNEIIKIEFKNKIYEIEKNKFLYVLSILENKDIPDLSEDEILELFEKYKLNDEIFLENINNLWN